MAKSKMRDIIVLLPGITGSVLQKDGKDIWALSGAAVFDALTSLGGSLQQMRIDHDDPEQDDLGDGVRATQLMPFVHVIPGLVKIDGYSLISQTIRDSFYVTSGD